MLSLILLTLLICNSPISSSQANTSLGTFRFETSASTSEQSYCINHNVRIICIVEFVFNNGTILLMDALWEVNGVRINFTTPDYRLIYNSKFPNQVMGVRIKNVQQRDNGTVFTCTSSNAPDNFTSTIKLNVTDAFCKREQPDLTIAAVIIVAVMALIFITATFFFCARVYYKYRYAQSRSILRIPVYDRQHSPLFSQRHDIDTDPTEPDVNISLAPPEPPQNNFASLFDIFKTKCTKEQISIVIDLSCESFEDACECLLSGPSLEKMLHLMSESSKKHQPIFVRINDNEARNDLLSFYKSTTEDDLANCQVMIQLANANAIDAGGVRRQIYTTILQEFAKNEHASLFDGNECHLRPIYTAQNRASNLFMLLGMIVGHSIIQDGIGFPYWSPLCYWYIAGGEQMASGFISLKDVGADCCDFIRRLRVARSIEEVSAVCSSDSGQELLGRAGFTNAINLNSKEEAMQSVMQHEALYKFTVLLDQFKEGLRKANVLHLVQAFPSEFAPLFTFTKQINASDVNKALYLGNTREDVTAMGFLRYYIQNMSQKELVDFLIFITGTSVVTERSIMVIFHRDEGDTIIVHTCSREISLPFGAFKEGEYYKFKLAMDAVLAGPDKFVFNIA